MKPCVAIATNMHKRATSCCEGKQGHTRKIAKQIAARQRKFRGVAVDTYKCPNCNLWHIGHNVLHGKNRSA